MNKSQALLIACKELRKRKYSSRVNVLQSIVDKRAIELDRLYLQVIAWGDVPEYFQAYREKFQITWQKHVTAIYKLESLLLEEKI